MAPTTVLWQMMAPWRRLWAFTTYDGHNYDEGKFNPVDLGNAIFDLRVVRHFCNLRILYVRIA